MEDDSTDSPDIMYEQFVKRQRARGKAGQNGLVVNKSLNDLKNQVREKLLALGHPTYKTIAKFMNSPKYVNHTTFHQLLRDLGFRISKQDSTLLFCSITGSTSSTTFLKWCQSIVQDKTLTWDELRESTKPILKDDKFTFDLTGSKKRLRPVFRDERLNAQQSNAANHFSAASLQNKGVEALVQQQLIERSKHKHSRTLLIKRIFQPSYNPVNKHRLCRASSFVSGIRNLGITISDSDIRKTIQKYMITLNRNGITETKLIDLDRFINVGISQPDINQSPAAAITKEKIIKRISLPNRGIPDDYGIRRIGTPKLKQLILQKIDQRSKPGGGMCLGAFRMFNPGIGGAITPKYFNQKLKDYGVILNQSRSDTLLLEVDKDGDGDVSFNEFANHFIPKGVNKGSLTDTLARGSGKNNHSRKMKKVQFNKEFIQQKNNMKIKQSDKKLLRNKFGADVVDVEKKKPVGKEKNHSPTKQKVAILETTHTSRSSRSHQNNTFLSDDTAWINAASPIQIPMNTSRSTFRGQNNLNPISPSLSSSSSYTNTGPSYTPPRINENGRASLLEKPLRSSPILRKAGAVRRNDDEFDISKPWYLKNRQPSRLNWRRLGVERAAGTISGSYSQCSLRKGAEKYQL
jgi:hypothetical protein